MPSADRSSRAIRERKEPDHEHVAMGEVDHADDAVNHGVADGDQAVDHAERDAVDELLQGVGQSRSDSGVRTRCNHAGGAWRKDDQGLPIAAGTRHFQSREIRDAPAAEPYRT